MIKLATITVVEAIVETVLDLDESDKEAQLTRRKDDEDLEMGVVMRCN